MECHNPDLERAGKQYQEGIPVLYRNDNGRHIEKVNLHRKLDSRVEIGIIVSFAIRTCQWDVTFLIELCTCVRYRQEQNCL